MKDYKDFKTMMDNVGRDIVKDIDGPVALLYSGGVDSTAIACSLKKADCDFYLLHMTNLTDNTGIRRNHKLFENMMSFHLGQYLDVPVLFNPTVLNSSPYMTAQRLGVNCFISGDGMDRCYGYLVGHGCEREATFGEDFHAFFPLVDKFLKTIPTRYKYYRSEYTAWDSSHEKELLLAKQYDVCVKKYSRHPSFIHFFEQYEKNVRDIVFPKLLTFQYAADGLGMPYYRFVRRVIRQHKNCFDPFFYRFFSHVTDRGLVFNANKLDKLYAESDRGGV